MLKQSLIAISLLLTFSNAFAYPQLDTSVKSSSECASKGGDWNATQRLCTIYVSDGSVGEGSDACSTAKAELREALKVMSGYTILPYSSAVETTCNVDSSTCTSEEAGSAAAVEIAACVLDRAQTK